MFKFKNILPWLIAIFAVAALAVYMLGGAVSPASAASEAGTALVTTINVTETIEASGYLKAQPYASLAWKTSGTVDTIYVQEGDQVKAGDVLMSLQTTSMSASIISARADLVNARNQLDALQHPTGTAIAVSQKNLSNAYAAWDKARSDLSSTLSSKSSSGDDGKYDDMTGAETDLADALDAFTLNTSAEAQWYYWAARMASLDRSGDYDYAAQAVLLRQALDSDDADRVDEIVAAQKKYEATVNDFAETLSDYAAAVSVNSSVAAYHQSAEGLMDALEDAYEKTVTPNPEDLSAAQARVDSIQSSMDSQSIIAPFDGEVLAIKQIPGDVVSSGAPALLLADRSDLYVDTQVDESDIARIKVGQPALITLDTLPGTTLNGTVSFINPVGELTSGLIKYSVRVELAPVDAPLLLGATADITIQVDASQDKLAVPAAAVQSDKSGEYVVIINSDQSTRRVPVESGALSGDVVVVSGDLKAGERVQSDYKSGLSMPNPFGK